MKQFVLTNGYGVIHYQADTRAACRSARRRMSRAAIAATYMGECSGDWASSLVIQTAAEVAADLRKIARNAHRGRMYNAALYSRMAPFWRGVTSAIAGYTSYSLDWAFRWTGKPECVRIIPTPTAIEAWRGTVEWRNGCYLPETWVFTGLLASVRRPRRSSPRTHIPRVPADMETVGPFVVLIRTGEHSTMQPTEYPTIDAAMVAAQLIPDGKRPYPAADITVRGRLIARVTSQGCIR